MATAAGDTRYCGSASFCALSKSAANRNDVFSHRTLVIPGLIVGVIGSLAARKVLSSALYGIEATNVAVMTGVVSVLALISFTAILAPALRARKVDPIHVLRA